MVVSELIAQLSALPGDAWCDAMFPNASDAYTVTGVELLELPDGRKFCIVEIDDAAPLKAV
jgi:hypothetical protein